MLPKNVYCGGIEASPAPAQKITFWTCFYENIYKIIRRGQRISKGGGKISKVVVFKKIFEKLDLSDAFQTTFCGNGGGVARDRRPPPLTAYEDYINHMLNVYYVFIEFKKNK